MNNKLFENKIKLQVQPQYSSREEWEAFAEDENLTYEVLELFMPPVLCEDRRFLWYQGSGRVTSVHGAFIDVNPASGDPEFCSLSRRRVRESCVTAMRLGARNVVFHSSCAPFLRGGYLKSWAEKCAEFYEELAQEYPMHIFIENSMDVDAEPLRELMDHIQNPEIGVCLDLGHANYSRMPLRHWFDVLGDRIGYIHLSDNRGLFDDHLMLGQGTVDWPEADRLWRMLGRPMPMTLETGGIQSTVLSLRFLKENEYFGFTEE